MIDKVGAAAVGASTYNNVYTSNPKRKVNVFEQKTDSIPPEIKQEQMARIKELLEKNGKIDPTKDKVFYNPKTGELDTIKPGGIYDPNQKEKTAKGAKVLGGLIGAAAALTLAFVFRGKIKSGAGKAMEAAKPFAEQVLTKGKELWAKGLNFVKPAITTVKGFFNKGVAKVVDKGGLKNILKDGAEVLTKLAGEAKTALAGMFKKVA